MSELIECAMVDYGAHRRSVFAETFA